jgi:hypothetical protein
MTTPAAVWKAPVTPAEVLDWVKIQSLAALPVPEIPAESLEAYWSEWQALQTARTGEPLDVFPPLVLDEIRWLQEGHGHLRLPNGSRWVLASGRLAGGDAPANNAFLRRLHALLMEHEALRQPHGSARTAMMLDADTLDVRRVFCTECLAWCDLHADAEEADRTLRRFPGYLDD